MILMNRSLFDDWLYDTVTLQLPGVPGTVAEIECQYLSCYTVRAKTLSMKGISITKKLCSCTTNIVKCFIQVATKGGTCPVVKCIL